MSAAPSILVVDDEPELAELLAEDLQDAGFATRTATDGRTAIELLARERFDAVVTDLRMPGLGGMELLEHVRSHAPATPVVLVTGLLGISDAEAKRAGAAAVLAKPFDPAALIDTLRALLAPR